MKRIKYLLILLVFASAFAFDAHAQSYPPSGTNYYHTDGDNYKFAIESSKLTIMFIGTDGNVFSSFVYYFDHNDGSNAVYYQDSYDYVYGTHQPNSNSWLKVALDGNRIYSNTGTTYYKGYKNLSQSNSSSNYSSGSSSNYSSGKSSTNSTRNSSNSRKSKIVKREVMCRLCYGSGKCHNCNGKGYHTNSYDIRKTVSCGNCHQTGRCPSCNGTGKKTHSEVVYY